MRVSEFVNFSSNSFSLSPPDWVLSSLFQQHVMYLRELRLAQMERMLAEFIFGVDIYLSVIRDDKDYKLPVKKNMVRSS